MRSLKSFIDRTPLGGAKLPATLLGAEFFARHPINRTFEIKSKIIGSTKMAWAASREAFFLMLKTLGLGGGIAILLLGRPLERIVAENDRMASNE